MNLRRLVIPLIAVLAIVALGAVATTTLVVASPQQSPSSQAGAAPAPAPDIVMEIPPKQSDPPAPKEGLQEQVNESAEPKSAPKATLDRGPKGSRIPPGPAEALSLQSTSGTVYTWQDGDRTKRVVLQNDLVAQSKSEDSSKDVIVAESGGYSIVSRQYTHDSGDQPVFKSESGVGLMTLPGGLMLALDPDWDQTAVDKFLEGNGINPDQVLELEFLENTYFVETDPGFPSLDLANSLADQKGVLVSSPNWQHQFETK